MQARAVLAAVALSAAAPAFAQSEAIPSSATTSTNSTIPEDAAVADKLTDDYKPIGGRIGSFLLYPTLLATGTATDNVLATRTDRDSDEYLTIRPAARLVSDAPDKRIALSGYLQQNVHAERTREDVTNFGTRNYFRLGDLGGNRIELNVSAERLIMSREDIGNVQNARSPIRRGRVYGDLAYTQVFNRLSLLAGVTAFDVNFHNATSYAGQEIYQGYRDLHSVGGRAEGRYNLLNGFSVIAKGSYDQLRYPFGPGSDRFDPAFDRNRDSYRVRAEAGVGASIPEKLYGEVTVGYLNRHFVPQPLGQRNSGGFSFSADVLWNVNPITSVRVTAARDFLDSASRLIQGYRSTGGRVFVQRAITPALLLEVSGRFAHLVAIGPTAPRNEFGGEALLTYRLSRRYAVSVDYRHSQRDTEDLLQPFAANYGTVGLRVTL